jgi:hypothetical protein
MSGLQLAFAHATKIALLALLAGILVRGRARLCWSFAVYVFAVLLGNTLVTVWPGRFYTEEFWVVKQGVYDVLKVAIALELAHRAFGAFPGALRTARRVLLAVLVLSTVLLAMLTPRSSYETLWEWQPSVATSAVWLLTATALLVVWYQIPIHDWPRAIMLGLAPYLLVVVTLMGLLKRHGWEFRSELGILDSLAYAALLVFWTWAAWRPEVAPAGAA